MRRRFPFSLMLRMASFLLLGAGLVFLFPPAALGPQVDPSWTPGCPELTTTWNELPSMQASHWGGAMPAEDGILEIRKMSLRPRPETEVVLTDGDGKLRQRQLLNTMVHMGMQHGDEVFLVCEDGFSMRSSQSRTLELVRMPADDFTNQTRYPLGLWHADAFFPGRLFPTDDGRVIVVLVGPKHASRAAIYDPVTNSVTNPVALPETFLPDEAMMLLPGGLLAGHRTFRPSDAQDSVIVVDPATGLEVAEVQSVPPIGEWGSRSWGGRQSSPVTAPFGQRQFCRMLFLTQPKVGLRVYQSHDRFAATQSTPIAPMEKALALRTRLWRAGQQKVPGFPDFERWNSPVQAVLLQGVPPPLPPTNWHRSEPEALPIRLADVEPAAIWTAATRRTHGLMLHAYNDEHALLTQVVYPTPRSINNGGGVLRLALVESIGTKLTWFGWVPLPKGYRKPSRLTSLMVTAMPDGLLMKLNAERFNTRWTGGTGNSWTCVVPYDSKLPRPDPGLLRQPREGVGG